MKKVLFGIMALSMAAFAANPGNITTPSGGTEGGTASVPVRVIAEVIAPTDALVITDAAGNILTDGLLIDHETRFPGDKDEKSVQFKVKRFTSGTFAKAIGTDKQKLTVTLDKTTTTLKHLKSASKITSTLALAGGTNGTQYEVNSLDQLPEHVGTITSNIEVATDQAVGAYDNRANQDPMPVLSVVLAAN